MKLFNAFRVFESRNYSLFFTGQLISRIGMWMQRTAVIWVVYTLTHSVFLVGLTTFAEQFPSFLLSPAGGIAADRYDRFKVLMVTQIVSALQAAALTLVYYYSVNPFWGLLPLSALLGVANAFDVPARQAMVNDMVSKQEDLPGAIAMNSSLNNLSRLVGPALSGVVMAKLGATSCFIANAVSFVAVIICLNLMKFPKKQIVGNRKNAWTDFREGLAYTRSQNEISKVLCLIGLVCLLVATYNTLQPFYARDVFKGNAAMYGFITAATGLGALVSTLFIAAQKNSSRLKQMLFVNLIALGFGLILMSHMKYLLVYLLLSFVCGFGTMSVIPICNTIIQTVSEAHMRGRVVGFFAMAAFGTLPIGALVIGWLAKAIHPQNCMLGQGILCLIIAAVFFRFLSTPMPVLEKNRETTSEN
ncbi:MFS transporter [Mucilaginibacter jinjuensis]|uniref:MFS transporter n=1 Tax=Mucilaginibacter jinjuensis TaxID=1176721 RepID=A0ABY7TA74_9SPHI|nr:MFS transporter [Mucilaginibacter jinjuensis]WCT13247.1 MFS transporter [Mucilaginibacter jinjuensis]